MTISEYVSNINKRYKTGISRELAYRGDLQALLEHPVMNDFVTTYPKARSNKITNKLTKTDPGFIPYGKDHENHTTPDDHRYPGEKLGKVQIDDEQYFGNVPLKTGEFYIGGYQPAQKWLKDRRDRTLSRE
jgi:hypothetical protein